MDKVKQTIHYWCDDIRNGRCTGDKIGIAVLDTGLSPHPDLSGRVKAFRDCVYGKETLYDDSGHGTHVAGILCGSGRMSGGVFAGMAPKAELVVVKMLDQKGEGSMEQMSAAVDWVKSNWRKYGIRIVNISVGARAGIQKGKEEEIVKKVEELWDEGLFVIAAAGNYGPRQGTITIPGTSRKVITTGALAEEKRGFYCSGEGPTEACVVKPDVLAPGCRIISCNGAWKKTGKFYAIKSGTSMAAPVVSGAMALLLSKYPDMSNVEAKLKLRSSSRRMEAETTQGWGLLQVEQLLE